MSNQESFADGMMRALREGRARGLDAVYSEGFTDAANISVSILTQHIDALIGKVQEGTLLKDEEQYLLAELTKVKAEMERELREFEPDGRD